MIGVAGGGHQRDEEYAHCAAGDHSGEKNQQWQGIASFAIVYAGCAEKRKEPQTVLPEALIIDKPRRGMERL